MASIGVVSLLLKIVVALGVALPLAAFVAGALVAVSEPSPGRERIVIQDDSPPSRPATDLPEQELDGTPPGPVSEDLAPDDDDADDRDDNGVGAAPQGRSDGETGTGDDEDDDGEDDREDDREDHREDDGEDDREDDGEDDD